MREATCPIYREVKRGSTVHLKLKTPSGWPHPAAAFCLLHVTKGRGITVTDKLQSQSNIEDLKKSDAFSYNFYQSISHVWYAVKYIYLS